MTTQTLNAVAPVRSTFFDTVEANDSLLTECIRGLCWSAVASMAFSVCLQIASILR